MDCPEIGVLDTETTKKLIETDPDELWAKIKNQLDLSNNDLATRIIKYMIENKYHFSVRAKEYNIVYVEGMNADGTENKDYPNKFNDRRIVIEIVGGVPIIRGNWDATSEPGTYYTRNPMNRKGAARIQLGRFKAWRVGWHKKQYPALRQAKSVTVHRDFNKDGFRTNDKLDTGMFGINHHHANNAPRHDIGKWSAGCLVGRGKADHEDFMKIIMSDRRYKLNKDYLFETTIIGGDDLQREFPIS